MRLKQQIRAPEAHKSAEEEHVKPEERKPWKERERKSVYFAVKWLPKGKKDKRNDQRKESKLDEESHDEVTIRWRREKRNKQRKETNAQRKKSNKRNNRKDQRTREAQ